MVQLNQGADVAPDEFKFGRCNYEASCFNRGLAGGHLQPYRRVGQTELDLARYIVVIISDRL